MKNSDNRDYEYIIKIIDFLESNCNISFFITSKDFDVLYKWWEKNISLQIIGKSILKVCQRWKTKKKEIYSFSNFEYEVKKNYKQSMELNVNVHEDIEISSVSDKTDEFFRNFPEDLIPIKKMFEKEISKIRNGSVGDLDTVYTKMVSLFRNDNELKLRKKIFLKNLMPGLVNPELERKFEINYLKKRYRIPDFELLSK